MSKKRQSSTPKKQTPRKWWAPDVIKSGGKVLVVGANLQSVTLAGGRKDPASVVVSGALVDAAGQKLRTEWFRFPLSSAHPVLKEFFAVLGKRLKRGSTYFNLDAPGQRRLTAVQNGAPLDPDFRSVPAFNKPLVLQGRIWGQDLNPGLDSARNSSTRVLQGVSLTFVDDLPDA